ncbi:hypothetical protein [Priestia megaterium]|uniref:hypothetical protein n=1 Tax=Priestia megaterium TaxID=1404 RepID=UPI0012B6C971|nr:hypothetical protein [Priestia megaterium]
MNDEGTYGNEVVEVSRDCVVVEGVGLIDDFVVEEGLVAERVEVQLVEEVVFEVVEGVVGFVVVVVFGLRID